MSNCSQGGRDEDKKDKDAGEGRDEEMTMEEEEDEERRMRKQGKDDEGDDSPRDINNISWAIGKFLILHFIFFVTNYIFRY
jgi:hypothetical protein